MRITLVSGSENTESTLKEQIQSYIGTDWDIQRVAMDVSVPQRIETDLLICSSASVERDVRRKVRNLDAREILTVARTLRPEHFSELVNLESGLKILFVNDHMDSARECIAILREIGFLHLDLIPCAPPSLNTEGCRFAITAGEGHLVPEGVSLLCDLGSRIMDFPSVLRIARFLGIDSSGFENPIQQYLRRIVQGASRIKTLNSRLQKMIEGLSEGLLTCLFNGEILVANEKAQSILMEDRSLEGRLIQNVLSHKGLVDFLLEREGASEKIINLYSRDVVLIRIIHQESRTVVCRLKVLSEIEEDSFRIRELRRKGFYAKYGFSDLIGHSPAMERVRSIGRKLADSHLTILLEGESGTGKELLASAIHTSSPRKDRPYVAVNLSAMNESLLESELFGYEPGAFTGASKEGKAGLFEQADGGTLLLDEIGDISPRIQKGLLRVLQEGEVLRVGGNRIRRVDVRIIAATNRNLAVLVRRGEFREDLLHRIRQGYVRLPSLRERKEDIPGLIDHLLRQEKPEGAVPDGLLLEKLRAYSWPGNVRELKNFLNCMLAISEADNLTLEDVPDGMFFWDPPPEGNHSGTIWLNKKERALLLAVEDLLAEGKIPTRHRLAEACLSRGVPMTPARARRILENFIAQGWIVRQENRYGLSLSAEGRRQLEDPL